MVLKPTSHYSHFTTNNSKCQAIYYMDNEQLIHFGFLCLHTQLRIIYNDLHIVMSFKGIELFASNASSGIIKFSSLYRTR